MRLEVVTHQINYERHLLVRDLVPEKVNELHRSRLDDRKLINVLPVCVELWNDQLIHVVEQVLRGNQELSCAVGVGVRTNTRCNQQIE